MRECIERGWIERVGERVHAQTRGVIFVYELTRKGREMITGQQTSSADSIDPAKTKEDQ